jgi:hypothetical protein
MQNSGLKNENFVARIIQSGSRAIRSRNAAGVHIFSGSVVDDGVTYAQFVKPKYDNAEIIKSVDTTIIELIPVVPPTPPDTVLRSVYNEVTQSVVRLTAEVTTLNGIISNLQSKIIDLEITSQSLRVQIDGNDLVVASLQNQNQQLSLRVQSTILDLQNALQRATSEAIQRVSLTARNEALLQENGALREELELTRDRLEKTVRDLTREASFAAQLAAGAFGSNNISANPIPNTDSSVSRIAYRAQPANNYSERKFINGSTITLFNAGEAAVTVTFEQLDIDFLSRIPPTTINPKGFATVNLSVDKNKLDKYKEGRDSVDLGTLSITAPGSTINIPMELQIQRGSSYRRPTD